MNRNKLYIVTATMLGVAGIGWGAYAQTGTAGVIPPRLLPYHGYLEDSSGPINDPGGMDVTFFITREPTTAFSGDCDSGDCAWTETESVVFSAGYFSATLGDGTPFPADLFEDNDLHLRVRIGSDTLGGAQRLLATPYAITAQVAQTFTVSTLDATAVNAGTADVANQVRVANGGVRITEGGAGDGGAGNTRESIHITSGTSGGQPVTLEMDSNELYASHTLAINSALGTLSLNTVNDQPVTVGGDLNIDGRITSMVVTNEFRVNRFANDPTGGVNPNGFDLGTSVGRFCYLTRVSTKSNNDAWNGCEIVASSGGTRWRLQAENSGNADADCYARCVSF